MKHNPEYFVFVFIFAIYNLNNTKMNEKSLQPIVEWRSPIFYLVQTQIYSDKCVLHTYVIPL